MLQTFISTKFPVQIVYSQPKKSSKVRPMKVFIADTGQGLNPAVTTLFSYLEKEGPILKSSKEVFIKVNGISFQPHSYTSPEVLKAVIEHLKEMGAKKVYVMENSTQANVTRLVYAVTGIKKVCKETGAKTIYLDEEKTRKFTFTHHTYHDLCSF